MRVSTTLSKGRSKVHFKQGRLPAFTLLSNTSNKAVKNSVLWHDFSNFPQTRCAVKKEVTLTDELRMYS